MDSPENEKELPPPFLYFDNLPAWRHEAPHAPVAAGPHAPTVVHRHPRKQGRTMRPYPVGAVLLIILFVGLALAVVCHNARDWMGRPKDRSQIGLLTHFPSPKVNASGHQRPGMSPHSGGSVELTFAKDKNVRPAQDLKSEWTLPLALEAGKAGPDPVGFPEPGKLTPVVLNGDNRQPSIYINETQPGVTPMLRNWTVLTYSSLLALTLSPVSSAFGGHPDGSPQELQAIKESVEALSKKLDSMELTLLKSLHANKDAIIRDVTEANKLQLETQIGTLSKTLTHFEDKVKNLHEVEKTINEIKAQLAKMEAGLGKVNSDTRTANALPVNLGRIELINFFTEDVLFVVNGNNYRVRPYEKKELLAQPSGSFKYEVIWRGLLLREGRPTLETGNTYTLTVRP
jgi:hypothetical protein